MELQISKILLGFVCEFGGMRAEVFGKERKEQAEKKRR